MKTPNYVGPTIAMINRQYNIFYSILFYSIKNFEFLHKLNARLINLYQACFICILCIDSKHVNKTLIMEYQTNETFYPTVITLHILNLTIFFCEHFLHC